MDKKYIFTDLDSTLSIPREGVPSSAKEAVAKLLANGHEVFAATGRNYYAAEQVFDSEHSGGIYSVGGEIILNGKVIKDFYFTEDDLKKIKAIADKYAFCFSIVTHDNVYVNGWAYENRRAEPYYEGHFFELSNYKKENTAKVNFHTREEQKDDLDKALIELDELGYAHCYKSIKTSVEITCPGVSKGSAIRWLADNGYIDIKNTIGIGDSYNDLEMLKSCAYSIAVGSGDKYIFDYVDMVTDDIRNDGFYKAFVKLGLID